MITATVQKQIAEAMKARDEIRLSTLKLLSSELHNQKIAKQKDLTQEEELEVVRHEAKKRKDAIEALRQAQGKPTSSGTNMDERIKKEEKELAILEEYLPQQMSDSELEKLVNESISQTKAGGIEDMGKVMGAVMKKASGQVDGGRVSQLVKEKLS